MNHSRQPTRVHRRTGRCRVPDCGRWAAAEWMVAQFHRDGILDQRHAAHEVARLFGAHLIYLKPSGAHAIDRTVLRYFAALAGDETVWSRSERHWRCRRPNDQPGRVAP
jgi:hypothetical protein